MYVRFSITGLGRTGEGIGHARLSLRENNPRSGPTFEQHNPRSGPSAHPISASRSAA
jgi:hypothetical protein